MLLSLGCSHSLGPYDSEDSCERQLSGLHYNISDDWPSHVAQQYSGKYRHIALPGRGMLTYYEVIKYLHEHKLLEDVDKLVIQWTHEPRLVLPNKDDDILYSNLKLMMESYDSFVLNKIAIEPCINIFAMSLIDNALSGNITTVKPDTSTKIFLTEMMNSLWNGYKDSVDVKNINHLIKKEIKNICNENNIAFYDFCWIKKINNRNGLDLDNNIEYTNNYGHLNSVGNKKAVKLILEELGSQGLFDV